MTELVEIIIREEIIDQSLPDSPKELLKLKLMQIKISTMTKREKLELSNFL